MELGLWILESSSYILGSVWQPTNAQWWTLLIAALLIVAAWPPADDRSLAMKFVNWAVDPGDRLPTLPPPYGPGEGDDLEAVNAHDLQTRMYDELYNKGGWTRLRLDLKVARDPFNAATERQVLVAIGIVAAFLVWRRRGNPESQAPNPTSQT